MKNIKRAFITPTLLFAGSSPVLLSSCSPFVVDEEIKNHDANGWQHAIEHIGSCKHPTLFLGESAAYYIQMCMNLFFSSAQYARENNYIYTNPGYEFNDQILLVYGSVWNYKENKPGEKSGYFAYKYGSSVDSSYGFSDILLNSKKKSNDIDLSLGNQMLITNYQDFDLSLNQYDKTRKDYLPYLNPFVKKQDFDAFIRIINKIIDLYEEKDPNIKFNFVVAEPPFDLFFDQKDLTKKPTGELSDFGKTIFRMIRHMDKFYICSDGSYGWSTDGSIKKYYDYFCRNGYTSARDQAGILHLLQTLPFNDALNYYKYINPWCFYNNEKYMVHFAPNVKTCYAKSMLNPAKHLTEETTCRPAAPWLIISKYKSLFKSTTYFNLFEKSILNFYNSLSEGGELKKFENFIRPETRSNFDKTKKNLIFIMPGALCGKKNPPAELWDECKKITNKIKENYPVDKWNYIYKLHPGATPEDAEIILKNLLGDPVPNNCVVLEQTYPFEYLISLDQTLCNEGIEDCYHLIDPTTFTESKPSGILTGFDICSSCFYSSMSMLVNEHNRTWDEVKKLIQNDAYYFPKKFHCYKYIVTGKDFSAENYNFTKNFYRLLNEVNEFVDINQFHVID